MEQLVNQNKQEIREQLDKQVNKRTTIGDIVGNFE